MASKISWEYNPKPRMAPLPFIWYEFCRSTAKAMFPFLQAGAASPFIYGRRTAVDQEEICSRWLLRPPMLSETLSSASPSHLRCRQPSSESESTRESRGRAVAPPLRHHPPLVFPAPCPEMLRPLMESLDWGRGRIPSAVSDGLGESTCRKL